MHDTLAVEQQPATDLTNRSLTVMYEIRDYHYRRDIFDEYKKWAEAAVVVLRDKPGTP